jgi:hypothetical protein
LPGVAHRIAYGERNATRNLYRNKFEGGATVINAPAWKRGSIPTLISSKNAFGASPEPPRQYSRAAVGEVDQVKDEINRFVAFQLTASFDGVYELVGDRTAEA